MPERLGPVIGPREPREFSGQVSAAILNLNRNDQVHIPGRGDSRRQGRTQQFPIGEAKPIRAETYIASL